MQHVLKLTASITDDDEYVHSKAVAISRLLDRIMKLDIELKTIYPKEEVVRFEYVLGNRAYNVPPWVVSKDINNPERYTLVGDDPDIDERWSPVYDSILNVPENPLKTHPPTPDTDEIEED